MTGTRPKYTPVRIRVDLMDRVSPEAEARGVSAAWLVNRLLAEGLDRLRPIEETGLTRSPQ